MYEMFKGKKYKWLKNICVAYASAEGAIKNFSDMLNCLINCQHV